MDLGLKGKVALVTAASKGIGRAIALGLAREGATVVISSRSVENLRKAASLIEGETGAGVYWCAADLTRKEDLEGLAEYIKARLGGVDILVFNTGGPRIARFMETTEEDWENAVNLLLMSAVRLVKLLTPHMMEKRWGRIVFVTSYAVKQPVVNIALSNVVRISLIGLTKTLSIELAPYNILVNAIMPGLTLTERMKSLVRKVAESRGISYEEALKERVKDIPLGRAAEPEEIANLAVFLASEKASYITGAIIPVDGGIIKAI